MVDLKNVSVALSDPEPTAREKVFEGVLRLNEPENVAVVIVGVGEGDGDTAGDAVVTVDVAGDQASGPTGSRKLLDAVFQCVARYEPDGGFVE